MRLSVDVHNFLQNQDVQHEFFIMETATKCAEQAAAVLGLNPKEVVSSNIVFFDEKPVNIIIPANKKISLSKLKAGFPDAKIRLASEKTAMKTTGYIVGATPPVALKTECATIIDQNCLNLDVLYTGGGEPNAMLKIRPLDLKKLTKAQVLDISE